MREPIFTDVQNTALDQKLKREHVSERSQGSFKLSYIEGHHAIREANRIFGFDGWDRQTLDLRVLAEGTRSIRGSQQGHGVSYSAKVRISVYGPGGCVTREGCGVGHGIDRSLGMAHESAIKEAETDAMKRALMTFGDPFGLALYSKDQENVE